MATSKVIQSNDCAAKKSRFQRIDRSWYGTARSPCIHFFPYYFVEFSGDGFTRSRSIGVQQGYSLARTTKEANRGCEFCRNQEPISAMTGCRLDHKPASITSRQFCFSRSLNSLNFIALCVLIVSSGESCFFAPSPLLRNLVCDSPTLHTTSQHLPLSRWLVNQRGFLAVGTSRRTISVSYYLRFASCCTWLRLT